MIGTFRQLLIDPDQFFADADETPDLLGPGGVVAAIVVLGLATLVIRRFVLPTLVEGPVLTPGGSPGVIAGPVAGLVAVPGRLFGPFLWWMLFATLFYLVTELFDGSGSFRAVLAVTGWGLVPRVIAVSADLLGWVAATIIIASGPGTGRELLAGLSVLTGLLAIGTTVWSGYLWGHGLEASRDVSRREGYLAAAPVVLLGALLALVQVVTALVGLIS